MGNTFSIQSALKYVGIESVITDNEKIMNSKAKHLPGVGAFPKAMKKLKKIRQNYIKCHKNKNYYWYMFRSSITFERSYENKLTKG